MDAKGERVCASPRDAHYMKLAAEGLTSALLPLAFPPFPSCTLNPPIVPLRIFCNHAHLTNQAYQQDRGEQAREQGRRRGAPDVGGDDNGAQAAYGAGLRDFR